MYVYSADFCMKPDDDCAQSKHVTIEKRVSCVFVAAGTCLPRRCIRNAVSPGSGSTTPAFRRHVMLHSKVVKGETQTQISRCSHVFLISKNKESGLKTKLCFNISLFDG
jgi:hypothetical protein